MEERLLEIERRLERLETCVAHVEALLRELRTVEGESRSAIDAIKAALAQLQGREIERERLGRIGIAMLPFILGITMIFGVVLHKLGLKWE